jgi:hypothetical protein
MPPVIHFKFRPGLFMPVQAQFRGGKLWFRISMGIQTTGGKRLSDAGVYFRGCEEHLVANHHHPDFSQECAL